MNDTTAAALSYTETWLHTLLLRMGAIPTDYYGDKPSTSPSPTVSYHFLGAYPADIKLRVQCLCGSCGDDAGCVCSCSCDDDCGTWTSSSFHNLITASAAASRFDKDVASFAIAGPEAALCVIALDDPASFVYGKELEITSLCDIDRKCGCSVLFGQSRGDDGVAPCIGVWRIVEREEA